MDTDRNLLFGVLALQAAFLDNDQFAQACSAWAARKQTPLADLLVERGWLQAEERQEVERLLERHVKRHGGDVKKSLGAVADGCVRDIVRDNGDAELRRSLSSLPPAAGYVLVSTTDQPSEQRLRYSLTRIHGEGGLGRVYIAHDNDLNRDVAYKEIKPDRAGNVEMWRRFLKEAQITGQLEHPNIVPVYELARRLQDNQPFYTMRFVRGQTLREAVKEYHRRRKGSASYPLALHRHLTAFISVCQAVGYAHSRGVIHRDLKPDNVVLGGFGEVVVLDWGLAKMLDAVADDAPAVGLSEEARTEATQAGRALGSPAYMSPEQAEGRTDLIDTRTDIYGLGAILFEILTGLPPHRGKDTAELLREIIHGDVPQARNVEPVTPAALGAICAKAMAKKRADRYGKATELAEDVQRYLGDEAVTCCAESVAVRAGRFARHHRTFVTTAAAVLLVALVGLGTGLAAVEHERQKTANALLAETHAKETEKQARLLAMDSLRSLTDDIVEKQMASKLKLTDEDREFLQSILKKYQQFAALPGEDPEQRLIRAEGHFRFALVRARLGEEKEAEVAYREAARLYEQLAADFPSRSEFRDGLAKSHLNLGVLLCATGRLKEAEAVYTEAHAVAARLAAEFPTRPDFSKGLAGIKTCVGNLFFATGRLKDAEGTYAEVLTLRKKLANDFPNQAEYRWELASGDFNLGCLLFSTGRLKEARIAYADAIAIQKKLVAEFPTRPEYRTALAGSDHNLGNLFYATRQFKEAEAALTEALAIRKQLADDFPVRTEFRAELARGHYALAATLDATGRRKAAETEYAEALALRKQLVADFPNRPEFRQSLARSHSSLGNVFGATRRFKEAEAAYLNALAICNQLAAEFPNVPDHRFELAATLGNLATLASDQRDFANAKRLLEEAVPHHQATLQITPRNAEYRRLYLKNFFLMIQTCAALSSQADALQTAERLRDVGWDPPADAYDGACRLALCISVVEHELQGDQERRKQQARFYADQAMTMLRAAFARGYTDAAHMKQDKDLDALRDRDDFKKLLAELEAKGKEHEAKPVQSGKQSR